MVRVLGVMEAMVIGSMDVVGVRGSGPDSRMVRRGGGSGIGSVSGSGIGGVEWV